MIFSYPGTGACNGDSGGGLYFEDDGIYHLRGVVSIAKSRSGVESFCHSKAYVVFTDVAKYLDWIQEKLGQYIEVEHRKKTVHKKAFDLKSFAILFF